MNNPNGNSEKILLQLAADSTSENMRRLALVVRESRASYAAQAVRNAVPTCVIETLPELRAALSLHFMNQFGPDISDSASGVMAFDITKLSTEDTALFAAHLHDSEQLGTVYILTSEQYAFFEPAAFDFTVR